MSCTKTISDIEVAEACTDITKTIKPKRFSSRRIPCSIEYEDFAEENLEQDFNSKYQKEPSKVCNEKVIMKGKEASDIENKNMKTQKKENRKNRFEIITQTEITADDIGFQFSEKSEKKERKVDKNIKEEVELKEEKMTKGGLREKK